MKARAVDKFLSDQNKYTQYTYKVTSDLSDKRSLNSRKLTTNTTKVNDEKRKNHTRNQISTIPPYSKSFEYKLIGKEKSKCQVLCKSGKLIDKIYYWSPNAPPIEEVAKSCYFDPERLKKSRPETIAWFYEQWQIRNM